MEGDLLDYEIMALRFLAQSPDVISKTLPDDDGETVAAILVYSGLARRGLVLHKIGESDISWSLTTKGAQVLQNVKAITPPRESGNGG